MEIYRIREVDGVYIIEHKVQTRWNKFLCFLGLALPKYVWLKQRSMEDGSIVYWKTREKAEFVIGGWIKYNQEKELRRKLERL